MSMIEDVRRRLMERMQEVRARVPMLREGSLLRGGSIRGQIVPGLIGGGKVIETISQSVDRLIAMAKERRPNIIPTVLERVRTFEPGKRVREFIPTTGGPAPTTGAPPPTPSERKRLLRG